MMVVKMTMNKNKSNANLQCHNDWQTLTTIGHDKNRFCDVCQRVVRLCTTETEKDLNLAIGRLVAFQPKIKFPNLARWLGGGNGQQTNIPEANVYLLPEQTLNTRQREEITMLFPNERQAEEILSLNSDGTPALLFRLELSLARQLVEDLQGDFGILVELEGEEF